MNITDTDSVIEWIRKQSEIVSALKAENKRLHYNITLERQTYTDLLEACRAIIESVDPHGESTIPGRVFAKVLKAAANAQPVQDGATDKDPQLIQRCVNCGVALEEYRDALSTKKWPTLEAINSYVSDLCSKCCRGTK